MMLQASNTQETRDAAKEVKCLITPVLAAEILKWSRSHLSPDPHAGGEFADEYRTTSLYFDTENLDVYHRRGSFKRSKYRIRRYGTADVIFLERKLRTSATVAKRRTTMGMDGLQYLAAASPNPGWPGYWFQRRLEVRRLAPKCQVSYRRVARVGMGTYGPMRLTVDREILATQTNELEFLPDGGIPVMETHFILEMKFRVEVPLVFKRLTEEFGLVPAAVSKYRLSLEALDQMNADPSSVREPVRLSRAAKLDPANA